MTKTCIIIAGPTATGKTSLAIDLATHFDTEIISADSRQCYRELNIGVAKPSAAQLQSVPHHFIDSHSIQQHVTAASFEQYALQAANKILEKNDVVIMCGGTGLYINAFVNGLDTIPAIPDDIRKDITAGYATGGLQWLQEQIRERDPDFYETGEILNPRRLMRALEVVLATSRPVSSFRSGSKVSRAFQIITFVLGFERSVLNDRINTRVHEMLDAGLEDEVRSLLPFRELNALQTVGYQEFFGYFDNLYSKERAIDLIKQNTRRYAKRQTTWFRNNISAIHISGEDLKNKIIRHVK